MSSLANPALMTDVDEAYKLHVASLGRYAHYTVYQSTASVEYFREIVQGKVAGQQLVVAKLCGKIAGFYLGVSIDNNHILNYIAVASGYAGQGIGTKLLDDFEHRARVLNKTTLLLDTFIENSFVMQWYKRHGFREISQRYLVRFRLYPTGRHCNWIPGLEQALAEECRRGFSKLTLCAQAGNIVVGLIGGNTCKILERGCMSFASAVAAVRTTFCDRKYLVCTNEIGDQLSEELSKMVQQRDCSVRMMKVL